MADSKVKLLMGDGKPKVNPSELKETIEKAGMSVGDRKADFGLVVGGDGRFGRYGRTESIPLLFVGVRSRRATGSKAFMAAAYYDDLPAVLQEMGKGNYAVAEHKRLEVLKNGRQLGEVFTDVYLERGAESTCLRYRVTIEGQEGAFEDEAIGDGAVVTTAAGATGYYSYPDRISGGTMDPTAHSAVGEDQIGICHVTPTFTRRAGTELHPLRYTLPWGTRVELTLFRKADARLYGTTDDRGGVKVTMKDRITVLPGKRVTRLVSVPHSGVE